MLFRSVSQSRYECRKKKAREWRIRLAEEIRHNKSYFVTLTIDDDNLEMLKNELEITSVKGNENNIATLALRKFLERCRKKTGKSLKHWCATELGEDRGRIHLHGIFFGNQAAELTIEKWKYGYVFIGNFVNEKTINYISKYMLRDIKTLLEILLDQYEHNRLEYIQWSGLS